VVSFKKLQRIGRKVNPKMGPKLIDQLTKNNPVMAEKVKFKLLGGIRGWAENGCKDMKKRGEVPTVDSLFAYFDKSQLDLCTKAGISENEIKEVLEAVLKA
jgi:hypothetical protein